LTATAALIDGDRHAYPSPSIGYIARRVILSRIPSSLARLLSSFVTYGSRDDEELFKLTVDSESLRRNSTAFIVPLPDSGTTVAKAFDGISKGRAVVKTFVIPKTFHMGFNCKVSLRA
jgi:hypothetical protein